MQVGWRDNEPVAGVVRIARCYDPRPDMECWCYRSMSYNEASNSWQCDKPWRKRLPVYPTLAAAKQGD